MKYLLLIHFKFFFKGFGKSSGSIITTNKKRTATAPTYTIINIIAKNSACKITKRPAALKKAKIRNKTEWTGFLDEITIKDESSITAEKI